MWGGSIIGGFLGGVLLLLRRKLTIPVFAFGWVCSAIVGIYTYVNPPPQGDDLVSFILVLIAALMVLAYAVWLSRKGVLR